MWLTSSMVLSVAQAEVGGPSKCSGGGKVLHSVYLASVGFAYRAI